ncbi:MAG: PepSY domain-containing protein [Methylovirgula sp.]
MRHAGPALAVFLLAGVHAMAAGSGHPVGTTHLSGARLAAATHPTQPEHECYSAAQTRREIAAHKLAEPFGLLVGAASRFQAEALGVKLCRHKEQYIYEISLLRTSGRVVHVFTNAVTGQILSVKNAK